MLRLRARARAGTILRTNPAPSAHGLRAAHARSDEVDAAIRPVLGRLPAHFAALAIGGYGRRELTSRAEVEVVLLHDGSLSSAQVTPAVWFPLWEHEVHLEPLLRTVDECVADARRSLPLALA